MSIVTAFFVGWLTLAGLMLGLWLVQRRSHNAGTVDIAWSFGTAAMAVWLDLHASGDPQRRVLVAVLAGIWGLRLGVHLAQRVMSEYEDKRYAELRESWGDKTQTLLFWFFQVQALWAVLFAVPIWIAAENPTSGLRWFDIAGAAILIAAVAGEWIADAQLKHFRRRPDSEGKVCNVGLWRYSRHPNYFFEWLGWWCYPTMAMGYEYGWVALLGPVLMYLFINYLTGIPPTEKALLKSRGEAYRKYQDTTNAFFPGPRALSNENST